MDLHGARGAVREYVAWLLEEQCALPEFRDYLGGLLQIPGLVLSEYGGSGVMTGALLAFHAVCPDRDWRDVIPGVAAGELLYTTFQLIDKAIDGEVPEGAEDWDPEAVCNASTVIQTLSFRALLELRERRFSHKQIEHCIRHMCSGCARVAEAQHLDHLAERIQNPTLELAHRIATGKSASIDQIIGQIGAGLGTDDAEIVGAFTEFSAALGVYSALANDLNDALPENTHKADVRRRKKTLPIVYLMSQTPSGEYVKEKCQLRSSDSIPLNEEIAIRQALLDSGAIDYTSVVAESYRLKAQHILRSVEDRVDVSPLISTLLKGRSEDN